MTKEMDIELLVHWALIDNGLAREFGHHAGKVDWAFELGTIVDTSYSGAYGGGAIVQHGDARHVCDALRSLPEEMARGSALVYQHALGLGRPDWCEEGPGQYVQMIDGRGRARWIWENEKSRTGKREPMLELVGVRPELCAKDRAMYQVWWVSLQALVDPLNAVMVEHVATGPRAAFAPWELAPVKDSDGQVVKGLKRNDGGKGWQEELKRGNEGEGGHPT